MLSQCVRSIVFNIFFIVMCLRVRVWVPVSLRIVICLWVHISVPVSVPVAVPVSVSMSLCVLLFLCLCFVGSICLLSRYLCILFLSRNLAEGEA